MKPRVTLQDTIWQTIPPRVDTRRNLTRPLKSFRAVCQVIPNTVFRGGNHDISRHGVRPLKLLFTRGLIRSSLYSSQAFKFIVEDKALYIHAGLVSLHSKPLDRMINGPMSEAREGTAKLEDIDAKTFTRFIQWAYNGFYVAADVVTNDEEAISYNDSDAVAMPNRMKRNGNKRCQNCRKFGYNNCSHSYCDHCGSQNCQCGYSLYGSGQSSRISLKEAFISRQSNDHQNSSAAQPPEPNKEPTEDYAGVFLSHAQLPVFADKYEILPLRALALENLHAVLAIFTLHEARIGDILELLDFTYGCVRNLPNMGDLRQLMKDYLGFEMDMLMRNKEFGILMNQDVQANNGGALLEDFMEMVRVRI